MGCQGEERGIKSRGDKGGFQKALCRGAVRTGLLWREESGVTRALGPPDGSWVAEKRLVGRVALEGGSSCSQRESRAAQPPEGLGEVPGSWAPAALRPGGRYL